MAHQLAIKNNLPHPFCNEEAGKYWFLRRHLNLALKTPHVILSARI